jgi:tetratricopeptide (TPR) repeat protein
LKEITEKANQYFYKADYRKALDILREADPLLFIPKDTSQKYALNAFFNLRAACYKKTNDWKNALADYTQAFNYGNCRAGNHLISIYLDIFPDVDKALDIAMKLGDFSDYQYNKYGEENYALKNKTGYIQILRGDKKAAEEIFRKILKDFASQNPERIDLSIKDLRKIIDDKNTNAGIAEEILIWFTRQG